MALITRLKIPRYYKKSIQVDDAWQRRKQEGRYDWTLVPLGTDCEYMVKEKLETMLANVNATEPIWRSTNMDQEKLRLLPRTL